MLHRFFLRDYPIRSPGDETVSPDREGGDDSPRKHPLPHGRGYPQKVVSTLLKQTLSLVCFICVLTSGQAQNMAPVTLGVQLLEGKQIVSINAVLSGGLAEKMKLQKGDVIQEIGGVKIKSQSDLRKVMAKIENSIEILILRDGKEQEIKGKIESSMKKGERIFIKDK